MKKRNSIVVIVISAVIFIGVLINAIEALSSGNGGSLFISIAVLWLLGTIISSHWVKVKPLIERMKEEDLPLK